LRGKYFIGKTNKLKYFPFSDESQTTEGEKEEEDDEVSKGESSCKFYFFSKQKYFHAEEAG
jgi:hypothetical protein